MPVLDIFSGQHVCLPLSFFSNLPYFQVGCHNNSCHCAACPLYQFSSIQSPWKAVSLNSLKGNKTHLVWNAQYSELTFVSAPFKDFTMAIDCLESYVKEDGRYDCYKYIHSEKLPETVGKHNTVLAGIE